MKLKNSHANTVLVALLLTLLMVACGDKPEALLASAKDYIAKKDSKAAIIQIKNALQGDPNFPEARFLLGVALLDAGESSAAETELRKALELKYPQEQVIPLLAQAMLAQGKARKLVDEWAQTQLETPLARANLLTTLASAHATLGQAEAFQAALKAALLAQPAYAPALILQARQMARQRDFDGALAMADTIIAHTPASYDARSLKGDLLRYVKNQLPEALMSYRKAIEINPTSLPGHAAVISILMQQGNLADAAKQMEQMKKFAGNHPQTKFLGAQLAFQGKDFKQARDLIQQVLNLTPDFVPALQLAGAIELQLNSVVQAEAYFTKALQAAPELPLARRMLVMIYLRSGQTAKAMATLAPGLAGKDPSPELYAIAGEAYLQSGDIRKAEEFFGKASKHDPKNTKARTSLALTHLMSGDVDAGFSELQDIAATDTGTTADLALISVHLRRQEFDRALAAIDRLEKKQADRPLAANLRGRTLMAKKDMAGARKSFERALAIDPDFFPAAASLAGLDLADNKPADAQKRFEAVLTKDPKSAQALLALAELAARSGAARDEVARLVGKAVAANPAEVAPRLLLVDFHLRNKDTKQAVSVAQDAVAAIPDSPELLDALGRAQLAAGDVNQAIASFNKLATMQPLLPQPHMRLADAHMVAKDKEAAARSLRKALELKPDLKLAQRASVMLDVDSKNIQGAVATARTMQKQSPTEAVGYVLEGDINASQKNWDSAATAYRGGLKQVNSAELAIKLHAVLLASGKTAEADRFSSTWQKDNPKDPAFPFYLGDRAIAAKDYAGAEKYYAAVIKLQPNNAIAYNNLAWVSARLNKAGAIALAEKANALSPNQPAFMDTLALLLSDKGEYAKALELQGKAIALQPQNALFKLNLAKIHSKGGNKDRAKKELDELARLGDKFGGQAEVAALLKSM